ncbi:efflux transporter outer membrane subunit [Pusillimonas sp. DMV24BSW_D]|uniref:efflux transporter outer membrane subunit n=1 Tax=Neopusillimonas aestuarii TaxID=2716226 RepID=UPI00140E6BAD|nr:efflux transporter outer membrane subunit [Pusillimonas sp. DMV24BSW_D]QIM48706.1 efflux transporter outer membrane subunit [Pusillimonas sp. DMV24BSW_D]
MERAKWFLATLLTLTMAGCAVGPDYTEPGVELGQQYENQQGWVRAQPNAAALRADWWTLFDDPVLNGLMDEVLVNNQTIAQFEAQYRQAQALLRESEAQFFPSVNANAGFTRSGSGSEGVSQQYRLAGTVSWEPDLWGRIRRTVEAESAQLQASEAELAGTRLSVQSTLAQTYFRLRSFDAELRLYEQTVEAYRRSLQTTENRLNVGVAAQLDVESARVQLNNALTQQQALRRQRAQLENAMAVLLGKPPSQFSLPSEPVSVAVPSIPAGLPSELLQRRPDIASAERQVAAANAQIGVAQSAWFPNLTLTAEGGYRAGQWAQWLSAPFSFWSLGPALAMTIFDGGAREARIEQARAGYEAQVAVYRQTVLTALREVEDYLVDLNSLAREQQSQQRALDAARASLRLTLNQYDAGLIDYLSVVQVETTALAAERASLSLSADRLVAAVQLIAALGGGWQQPTPAEVRE